jgi:hypothetical protein
MNEIGTTKVTVIVTALFFVSAMYLGINRQNLLGVNIYWTCNAVLSARSGVFILALKFLKSVTNI